MYFHPFKNTFAIVHIMVSQVKKRKNSKKNNVQTSTFAKVIYIRSKWKNLRIIKLGLNVKDKKNCNS